MISSFSSSYDCRGYSSVLPASEDTSFAIRVAAVLAAFATVATAASSPWVSILTPATPALHGKAQKHCR
jgi:hypothetical protein